jgi:hypothetical protein
MFQEHRHKPTLAEHLQSEGGRSILEALPPRKGIRPKDAVPPSGVTPAQSENNSFSGERRS